MPQQMFSIAMCTFNGARFLPEQLQSIAKQTRRPDELVVCDDGSIDNTVELVRTFARTAPFPVHLTQNPENLGTTTNFENAIRLCRGDLIVLADQDDIWRPDKLARLEQEFASAPEVGLVFSDAAIVDHDRQPLGYNLWQAIGFTPGERRAFRGGRAFASMLRRCRVTGATMGFRATFRDLIVPIPRGWLHDAWIALLISAVAPVAPVEELLIEYRQHPHQQIGGRQRDLATQYRSAREMGQDTFLAIASRFEEALDRLRGRPEVPPGHLRALEEKVGHCQARARMRDPGTRRLPLVLGEIRKGNYSKYSRGWKAVAQDLFLP
jgi:glycosyltransferase involved in cell wall biosynthesis